MNSRATKRQSVDPKHGSAAVRAGLGSLVTLVLAACSGGSEQAPSGTSRPPVGGQAVAIPELPTGQMEPLVAELLDARIASVQAKPESGKAWADLGFALDAHVLLEEAETCLREAVRLDETLFAAAYDFAFLGTLLPRDPEEVSQRFVRAGKLEPTYAPVFARHGDFLREGGDIPGATARYEEALSAYADYDYAKFGLARALLESDDPTDLEQASAALKSLFDAYPGDAAVATAFGQALSLTGEGERAATIATLHGEAQAAGNKTRVPILDTLRADIIGLSRSTSSNFQRGEKKLRKGDLAGAALEFERVLSAEPKNRAARIYLAKTLLGLRKLKEARSQLNQLLEENGGDPDAHALLGQLDTEAGAFDDALSHFMKVVQVARLDDLSYRAWVTALGSKGRWEEALFRLTEWEVQSPSHPEIGYLRALASLNAGKESEARDALKAAIQRAPDHPMRRQLELRIGR